MKWSELNGKVNQCTPLCGFLYGPAGICENGGSDCSSQEEIEQCFKLAWISHRPRNNSAKHWFSGTVYIPT